MDDHFATRPQVRTWLVWFAAASFLGVLLVAASTGSARVWTSPDSAAPSPEATPPEPLPASTPGDPADSAARIVGLIAVLVIMVMILLALMSALSRSPAVERLQRRTGWGRLTTSEADPLPGSREPALHGDLDGVRAALLDGDPRNGIVACWMQLERAASIAGLPRLAAETAQEYSMRVAGSSSIDPEPISELAELYREARFSDHGLGEHHRTRALSALTHVSGGLAARGTGSP